MKLPIVCSLRPTTLQKQDFSWTVYFINIQQGSLYFQAPLDIYETKFFGKDLWESNTKRPVFQSTNRPNFCTFIEQQYISHRSRSFQSDLSHNFASLCLSVENENIRTYIIVHYNPPVRITTQLLTSLMLCALVKIRMCSL